MNLLNAIIETGLIFLIVFTPLAFGSVHTWAYTIMELTVLLLVTLWFIKMSYEGGIKIPRTPLNIPILFFILLVIFQLIPLPEVVLKALSPNTHRFYMETNQLLGASNPSHHWTLSLSPYATKVEFFKLLAYIGVFYLVMGNTDKQTRRLLTAIVITGFLISLLGLIQKFTWNGKLYWFKEVTPGAGPFGPFINRNNFAAYINLIIPLSLGLLMVERDRGRKVLFGFLGVIMAVALFLSLSRGGIIAFLGGMAFMGILLLSIRYGGGYKRISLLLGGFLIAILLYLLYIGIGPVIDRLATLTEEETYLRGGRWVVWVATLNIVKDYPIFGSGLDTFEDVFPGYRPLEVSQFRWLDAHNDYIQFMAETGIVGLLIAFTSFAIIFKKAFSTLNNPEPRPPDYLLIGLLSSVVAFMISVIPDFHTHIPADALLFSVVMAITVRLAKGTEHRA